KLALGSKTGNIKFSEGKDVINHVLCDYEEGYDNMPLSETDSLDNILEQEHSTCILVKLDVEGYELEVLKGMDSTLANPGLKAIIVEINNSGMRYGYADEEIHTILSANNFIPCEYDPYTRKINELDTYKNNGNTIYLRDIEFVKARVINAPSFEINNLKI
ncbi:MAG: FkbM family methyltransferase, partial [Ferruginibacter sp.]